MKNILLILLLTSLSGFAFSDVTLNKKTAQQYFNATKSLEVFEDNHPEIVDSLNGSDFSNKSKFMAQIKSVPQFTDIEKAMKAAGLEDFEAFYDLSVKINGGMMALRMEQMPSGIDPDVIFSAQEDMIERMKLSKAPQEQIDELTKNLQEQKLAMKNMLKLGKLASEQDKKFVRDNMQWLMENMAEDDEGYDE